MSVKLEELDARLLDILQESLPLTATPFADVAGRLGIPPRQVLERVEALRSGERAPIRQISAIFDSKSLGYQTTLVAAKVEENQLPRAVAAINAHPGVSHNYRRDHAYNLWYTLAVGPDSRLGLQKTADMLHRQSGAIATRLMPTIKLYKIGVRLKIAEDSPSANELASSVPFVAAEEITPMSDLDRRLIRVLQRDLPAIDRPFDALAREAGVSTDELLAAIKRFADLKRMRRFSAVLRHRELGFDANAMGVWVVPPAQQDAFGQLAAGFAEVSHCYLRPTYPDWPYNLFTMIHTRQREAGMQVMAAISRATGIRQYAVLYSTQEYKKVRVKYFEDDIPAWEVSNGVDRLTPPASICES